MAYTAFQSPTARDWVIVDDATNTYTTLPATETPKLPAGTVVRDFYSVTPRASALSMLQTEKRFPGVTQSSGNTVPTTAASTSTPSTTAAPTTTSAAASPTYSSQMATYSVPGQNLTFAIPADGGVYAVRDSVAANNRYIVRKGQNIYEIGAADLGRQYMKSLGFSDSASQGGFWTDADIALGQKTGIQGGSKTNGMNGNAIAALGPVALKAQGIDTNAIPDYSGNLADLNSIQGFTRGTLTDLSLLKPSATPAASPGNAVQTTAANNPNAATVTVNGQQVTATPPSTAQAQAAGAASNGQTVSQAAAALPGGQVATTTPATATVNPNQGQANNNGAAAAQPVAQAGGQAAPVGTTNPAASNIGATAATSGLLPTAASSNSTYGGASSTMGATATFPGNTTSSNNTLPASQTASTGTTSSNASSADTNNPFFVGAVYSGPNANMPASSASTGGSANTLYDFYNSYGQSLPTVSGRAELYKAVTGDTTPYTGSDSQNSNFLTFLKQKSQGKSSADVFNPSSYGSSSSSSSSTGSLPTLASLTNPGTAGLPTIAPTTGGQTTTTTTGNTAPLGTMGTPLTGGGLSSGITSGALTPATPAKPIGTNPVDLSGSLPASGTSGLPSITTGVGGVSTPATTPSMMPGGMTSGTNGSGVKPITDPSLIGYMPAFPTPSGSSTTTSTLGGQTQQNNGTTGETTGGATGGATGGSGTTGGTTGGTSSVPSGDQNIQLGLIGALLKQAQMTDQENAYRKQIGDSQGQLANQLQYNGTNPIPLEFQTGRANVLTNTEAQREAAINSNIQSLVAQRTALTDAIKSAIGATAPVQVSPGNTLTSPQTGQTIGTPGYGNYTTWQQAQTNAALGSNYQTQAAQLDTTLKQIDTLTPALTDLMQRAGVNSGVNGWQNQAIGTWMQKVADPSAMTSYNAMMADLKTYMAQILGNSGLNPTEVSSMTNSFDPSSLNLSQLQAFIANLKNLGQIRLGPLQDAMKASYGSNSTAGNPYNGSAATPSGTSTVGTPNVGANTTGGIVGGSVITAGGLIGDLLSKLLK